MGVLKSPGTPFRACVRRALWRYHYLRAFSGVDTGAPGIKSDWCIYGIQNNSYDYVSFFTAHTNRDHSFLNNWNKSVNILTYLFSHQTIITALVY